ncbi:hypothetical protein AOL_s00079g444 [Orbilia oligospora ATCC 24927]|uniref:Uncharacterized protein n=2 Tax=Orbilia oligospora TaxID=2813651 RepID=G1XDQ9_ARTOA|nr:hypothetical protein AOL_s00079g444 [Orbilia oligospora ATCC 24927]EGX48805.1 hypothetical protein AOL_s00079g444 [Orbilia oligospora ATCC 24927]KAF3287333.1 hypothetical protein TWF970_007059 [Orbilia oligospora]
MLKTILSTIVTFAVVCTALPAKNQIRAPSDKGYFYPIWLGNASFTDLDSRRTDDAWIRKDLEFPLRIYGKTTSVVWVSMNGILLLEEPKSDTLTVPPSCNSASLCPLNNAIIAYGSDLVMKARTSGLWVRWAYHIPAPNYDDPHHHVMWYVCDKSAPRGPFSAIAPCASATRYFSITFHKKSPGVIILEYYNFEGNDWSNGIIRLQSSPNLATFPPSRVPQNADNKGHTCIIFDTNRNTYQISKDPKECTLKR